MGVKINVQYFLPHLTHDQEEVEVSGSTVGQCLEQAVALYPKLKKWVFKEDGSLTDFITIHTNSESSSRNELTRSVKDGEKIYLIMMLSGG
jgi:molybdopterin converting factor small subunit